MYILFYTLATARSQRWYPDYYVSNNLLCILFVYICQINLLNRYCNYLCIYVHIYIYGYEGPTEDQIWMTALVSIVSMHM